MDIFYENRQYTIYFQVNHNHFCVWPLHQHYWAEIVYTKKGITRVQYLQNNQLISVDVKPDELLFFFPNVPHRYLATPESGAKEFYVITFNPNINQYFEELCSSCCLNNLLLDTATMHEDVRYILNHFCNSDISAQPLRILDAYVTIFLERLYPNFQLSRQDDTSSCRSSLTGSAASPHEESMSIIQYVHAHFNNEEISLESVARQTEINKYAVSRFFSQKLQSSFSSYINMLRLSTAQAQLANTTKNITSIVLDCGYQNQQVFNRNFKKLLGITPSQYRERCFHFSLHPVDDQKQVVFLNQLVEGQNQVYLNGKYVCKSRSSFQFITNSECQDRY